jgi:hypothetical protein
MNSPAAGLLVFALTVGAPPLQAQHVGAVLPTAVAYPAQYAGNCPARVEFVGHVTVTIPGTRIDYRWERSNGDSTKQLHAQIGRPTDTARTTLTEAVPSDFWRLALPGHAGVFWEILHIESPFDIRSQPARVTVDCRD